MALKLTPKQQSQLAFLELLPPKIQRIRGVIEQMHNPKLDETAVRGMIRVLDEMKAGASQQSLNGLADALGSAGRRAQRRRQHGPGDERPQLQTEPRRIFS